MPDAALPELIALQQAVIGRYSLERELGRGGMGIVFLARDVALDRPVAIKLLPPAQAAQPALRERFLREAQMAAKLSQPNIVPIHAVEEAGALVYFVMAYVEGETLGDRIRTKGPLTPHEAARMLQEVAWALAYAHGRGVVHRDVKPDNIMLERGTGRAVVMDFGIARLTEAATGGEIVGTAQYMSPEQANGEPVDGRSDLYSLGVVGFLALAGQLPFEAEDTAGMLAMHITKLAPPLASVTAGVPSRLARVIDRCLQKNPADRFPTGEALAESISQTVEAKRELPVPVRVWLTKGQESRASYLLWYVPLGIWPSVGLAAFLNTFLPEPVAVAGGMALYFGLPFVAHGSYRLWRLRRLLAAGYGIEDARLAVRDHAERRREDLSYEFGAEPPRWARTVYRVAIGAGLASLAGFIGLMASLGGRAMEEALVLVVVATGSTAVLAWIVHRIRPGKRITKDHSAEWRLKFWSSRFAHWLERIARFGLKRAATPAELTYRPTELAIGLAAGALFESLPKEQRKELKELPALIERLERDAVLMRRTVDELGGAIAGLGEEAGAAGSQALRDAAAMDAGAAETVTALADSRGRLRADLVTKRAEAAQRLAAAVAALESIRLNLLRLKAGTGTVGELTADLASAREASQRLSLEAAAREEVEALLRGARQSLPRVSRPSGARRG
ncbi:MAG: serine/threonine protein kinase [Gemmatimonadetes bacterium]|nr:serine/threonine protein kinase [Gemmatimonadota bacterium]